MLASAAMIKTHKCAGIFRTAVIHSTEDKGQSQSHGEGIGATALSSTLGSLMQMVVNTAWAEGHN